MYLSGDDSGFFWSVLALAPVGLQEQIVKYLGFFFFLADLTVRNSKLVMVKVFTWWKSVNTLYQGFRVLFWFRFFGSLLSAHHCPDLARLGVVTQLWHSLTVWSWTTCLVSQRLNFLIHKMGMIIITSRGYCEPLRDLMCLSDLNKVLSMVPHT